jgi:hypothetical protein
MTEPNTPPVPHVPATPLSDDNHPLIRATSGGVRFVLEWAATVAELVVVGTIIVIVASDVSGGTLLANVPFLNAIYAWGQGFGIEGQMVAMAILARKAFQRRERVLGSFLALLVLLLGVITMIAVGLANYQQAFHVDIEMALSAIGISRFFFVWGRAVMLTITAVSGAFLLHMPKRALTVAQVAAENEQKRLRAALDAEDAAIAAERRRRVVAGWRDTAGAVLNPAMGLQKADELPTAQPAADATPALPATLATAIRRGRAAHVTTSADALAAQPS